MNVLYDDEIIDEELFTDEEEFAEHEPHLPFTQQLMEYWAKFLIFC